MSLNVQKQIQYWRQGASEDLNTARLLLANGKNKEALFFAHLTLEKALKALVVKATTDIPPYSHDLAYLTQKAGLTLTAAQLEFLATINQYSVRGRYPDIDKPLPVIGAP